MTDTSRFLPEIPCDLPGGPRPMIAVVDAKAGHARELRAEIEEEAASVRREPGCLLLTSAAKPGALRTQAVLVIVFFLIAIARAWQLIGTRGSMLLSVIAETAEQHRAGGASDPEPSDRRGTTAAR